MDQALVHCNGLSDGLGTIVTALIIGQVERLERAVITFEVLGDGLTTSEGNLV